MKKHKQFLSLMLAAALTAGAAPVPVGVQAVVRDYVVLEDVKAIQAYVNDGDYVGSGKVRDLNNDGCIDVFDLALAKRQLLKTGVPSLTDFSSETWDIYLNEETDVTFTVHVTEVAPLDEDAVALYDQERNLLGTMHDDGEDGDETADDGIYTAVVTLSSDEIKLVDYYAEAMDVRSNTHAISFYRDLEESEFEGFFALQDKLADMTFEEVCAYVKDCEEITEYTIDEAGQILSYQTIYRIGGAWLPEYDAEEDEEETSSVASLPRSMILSGDTATNDLIAAHPGKKDVLVLMPFDNAGASGKKFSGFGKQIAEILGGEYTGIYNQDVTYEFMKHLAKYGSVIIQSHGTYNVDLVHPLRTSSYIILGERYENGYDGERMAPLQPALNSGEAIFCSVKDAPGYSYVAVGKRFFSIYYNTNQKPLNDSIWYMTCCEGMKDDYYPSLAETLVNQGVGAVIGFSDTVSKPYANNMAPYIFDSLLQGNTVNTAINSAKKKLGSVDPTPPGAEVRFKGKKNFRLMKEPYTGKYKKIVDAVNVERTKNGLNPLRFEEPDACLKDDSSFPFEYLIETSEGAGSFTNYIRGNPLIGYQIGILDVGTVYDEEKMIQVAVLRMGNLNWGAHNKISKLFIERMNRNGLDYWVFIAYETPSN